MASTLLKIGSVILLVLGIVDILRGLITLFAVSVIGNIVGSYLASIFPPLGFLSWLLPLLGPILGGASIITGVVASVVGYQLMKLTTPIPTPQRDKWIIISAVLTAIALAFFSPWYLLAFALIIAGLLLSPTVQIPPSTQTRP